MKLEACSRERPTCNLCSFTCDFDSRFVNSDANLGENGLVPLVKWLVEYVCMRINKKGVVESV